jgi:Mrp family chromosome partitioning ATPase/capsular polysaccharide biosynthesis protein
MLDTTNRKRYVLTGVEPRVAPEPWRDGIGFRMFMVKVHQLKRRIIRLMCICAALGCLAGVTYNFLRIPTYTASSELLTANTTLQMSGQDAVVTQVMVENTLIQSEIEMLKSSSVLGRVVDRMGLEEIDRMLPRSMVDQLFGVAESSSATARQRALASLRANTTVNRVGSSLIIEVRVKALTPQDAARLTNELAEAFVQEQSETSAVVSTSAALRERIKVLGPTARIISEAVPPNSRDGLPRTAVLLLATLLGAAVGAGSGLTITSFDRRVRTAQQLDTVTSVECFGYVPKVKLGKGSRAWRGGPCDLSSIVARSVLRRARSAVLERSERMPHVVGITSCHGAEGKTTLAANWARFIAREGASVLFVDATHHAASAGEAGGLHELLRGEAALEDVIEPEVVPNLDLLRSGKAHGNPDLLWTNLVQAIAGRKLYQWVILDLPPLSSSADVRSAGQIIDDMLVVVEWGRTSESRIEQALRSLGPVRERVSGTIINKIPQSSLDPETLLEARAAFCASGGLST